MIELIAWIFEQLFGSQEPTARVGPRQGSDQSGYGQEAGGSQQPKTLAELLQEARAELEGGGARPAPPPQQQPAMQAPTPPPIPRPMPVRRQDVPGSRSAVPPPPAPNPQVRQVHPELQHLRPLASLSSQHASQQKRQQKQQQKRPKALAAAATAAHALTNPPVKAVATPASRVLAPWLSAMRSSKPESRRQAAMIALVGGIVMGPPKCRQHR